MKNKGIMKRIGAMFLSATLVATMVPSISAPVFAQNTANELPSKTQFATAEELKTFDTNDQNGKNPAKVYFGNNSQQWWIAGSQHGNLTLFAASPLAPYQPFETNWDQNKVYSADWNCDYTSLGGSDPSDVYPNHYGASPLRNALKGLETSYFTGTEQGLMKPTTIFTNDTKNSSTYSTTDKLYLAYGIDDGKHITVGVNSRGILIDGLCVDRAYWGKNDNFWLRAPSPNKRYYGLAAIPRNYVNDHAVEDDIALVPAFELNLSTVLFGSVAPVASSDGQLKTSDAFTLRYDASKCSKDLGSAFVPFDWSEVELTDVPAGTYLVAQNSAGAKAKSIARETKVSAKDMGLDSFKNCKVWLETTDNANRMTYATLATKEKGYNVNIAASEGLTVTNGTQSVLEENAITDITVKVAEGYYLPDNYISNLQGSLTGLRIAKTDSGFTISGTPTSDVNITLPAATVLPKSATPIVLIHESKNSITAFVENYQTEFGGIEYKWEDGNWEKGEKRLTKSNLKADTTYKLSVRFTGEGIYQPSDEYSVEITTLKDGALLVVTPKVLTTTYKDGLTLKDVELPTGWVWAYPNTQLSVGTQSYEAKFDARDFTDTHDFTGIDGFNPEDEDVRRNLAVKVNKADNAWVKDLEIIGWTYGETANTPTATAEFGEATFTYSAKENGAYTNEVPKNAGTYYVKATVAESANYRVLESAPVSFKIAKANPTPEKLTGLTLGKGQPLSKIELPKQFKWVDDTLTSNELGTYKFKAIYTPEDTANYNTIEVDVDVEVVPVPVAINHAPTISAKDITLTVGDSFDPLKDVTAKDYEDGDKVKLEVIKNTVDTSKVGTYEVTYKVTDNDGATVTKTIKVKVVEVAKEKETLENVINDKTSGVDKKDYTKDSYDAYLNALEKAQAVLKDPNASKEDINKALADLETAYKALKKVEITSADKNAPKTGDEKPLGLFTSLLAVSVLGISVLAILKKRRSREK